MTENKTEKSEEAGSNVKFYGERELKKESDLKVNAR